MNGRTPPGVAGLFLSVIIDFVNCAAPNLTTTTIRHTCPTHLTVTLSRVSRTLLFALQYILLGQGPK